MATIPIPGSELRHVRKTVTFTGGAGSGAVGTITLFTITGRVRLDRMSAFATVSVVSTGGTGTLSLGVASSTGALTLNKSADLWLADKWWDGQAFNAGIAQDFLFSSYAVDVYLLSESLILTIGTANVTAGTVIFDIWYRPITDDGALAGDDIDVSLVDSVWDEALSGHSTAGTSGKAVSDIDTHTDTEIAAIKAKTDNLPAAPAATSDIPTAATVADAVWDEAQSGHTTAGTFGRYVDSQLATIASYIDTEVAAIKAVTDLIPNAGALTTIQADLDDIQTRLPAALVSGRMDSSVGAMAAAVITAAAIATDAIDADALAADAVTEIWAKSMTELSAAPAVTGTVLQALEWIFLLARNKMTQTASTQTLLKDDGTTTLSTSAVSDNGTTFSRGEWA